MKELHEGPLGGHFAIKIMQRKILDDVTLALGSRPKQGLARVRAKREA